MEIRMGTLSARALRESLQKARNLGIVEERLTLFDDCELVVRNLRPDEYEQIQAEIKDENGIEYLYAFQLAHVKRAIVELNGQDFRDVQFVEDEEEDPKKPGQMRTIKLELADWLVKNVLGTWSKEAMYVAYRKTEDAVEVAELKAKQGIQFLKPDETEEDKLRRLVGEIKELEDSVPAKLYDHVLDESGFMRKSTAEEVKRAMEKADQIARDAAKKAGGGGDGGPPPVAASPAPAQPPQAPPAPPVAAQTPNENLMRDRVPMNQVAVDMPQPVMVLPTPRQAPTPATRNPPPGPPPPEQIHGPMPHGSATQRASWNAALEADADAAGVIVSPGGALPTRPSEVPVLEKKQPKADPAAAASVIDPKPKGGINPHFRPPPRGI
jgi:hypothetical protein